MSGPENDSLLNADLVLRRAFDVATGKLKVDAEVTATVGAVDVVIDAATGDNIAISDGTDVLNINSDGSINTQILNTSLPISKLDQAVRVDDYSTANITYFGYAVVGASDASAVWKIFTINETTGYVKKYADGDANYNNIWNNRTSLTYT